MSTETLRRAASLMRERAEAVEHPDGTESTLPWREEWGNWTRLADADATHIASWHPAVALAVADWLEAEAQNFFKKAPPHRAALAVARAYLGESA